MRHRHPQLIEKEAPKPGEIFCQNSRLCVTRAAFPGSTPVKALALQALDAALHTGVTYADVRIVEERTRHLTTKSGKPGHISIAETLGAGIRVLAGGCWGFAATDDL